MRLSLLLAAVAALGLGSSADPAEAAVVSATYVSDTLVQTVPSCGACQPGTWQPFGFGLSVDEGLLGQTVAGTTLTISQSVQASPFEDTLSSQFSMSLTGPQPAMNHSVATHVDHGAPGTIAQSDLDDVKTSYSAFESYLASFGIAVTHDLGSATGFADQLLDGATSLRRDYMFQFDAARNITGLSVTDLVMNEISQVGVMWQTGPGGDALEFFAGWGGSSIQTSSEFTYRAGPGTLQLSVVPLPASFATLAGSLALVAGLGWRGRRRPA